MAPAKKTAPESADAALAGPAADDGVLFRSESANLIVYAGGKEPIARFVGGAFRTSNAKAIEGLRACAECEEATV